MMNELSIIFVENSLFIEKDSGKAIDNDYLIKREMPKRHIMNHITINLRIRKI